MESGSPIDPEPNHGQTRIKSLVDDELHADDSKYSRERYGSEAEDSPMPSYTSVVGDVLSRRSCQGAILDEIVEQRETTDRIRGLGGWVALVIVVGMFSVFIARPLLVGVQDRRPYAAGARGDDDEARLALVIEALWKVRKSMDAHLLTHEGMPPRSLEELSDAPQTCPSTGKSWDYQVDGKTYSVACPSPQAVARSRVAIDHEVGPPRVSLRPVGAKR